MKIRYVTEMKIYVHVDHPIIRLINNVVNIIVVLAVGFLFNIVRAVGSVCTNDEQCGLGMLCKGRRCSCNETQLVEQISDIYGRPMQRCINGKI
jgi:hypothetical protein